MKAGGCNSVVVAWWSYLSGRSSVAVATGCSLVVVPQWLYLGGRSLVVVAQWS